MRHLPQLQHNSTATLFRAGARPALEDLPADIAALCREHDEALAREQAARSELGRLAADDRDREAAASDARAAKDAVRAGRPLPKPKAVTELYAARDAGLRQHAAEQAVLEEILEDLGGVLDDWQRQHAEDAAKARHVRREELHTATLDLVDRLEREVALGAVDDWLKSSPFHISSDVWVSDVVSKCSTHWGLSKSDTTPVSARQLLTSTVRVLLEEEETTT